MVQDERIIVGFVELFLIGVGLSMVRSIAENHRGAAYAKKTENRELEVCAELR